MNPLVTIAIPTYNRAASFLPDVIDAALGQTWQNVEVLIGDNASTDATPGLIARIDDSRLRYIRHPTNIGANGNFNSLLNEATGEWFLLLHDDDMIDLDFIETCMSLVDSECPYGFIRTGVRAIDANNKILKEIPNNLLGETRQDFYLSWFRSHTAFYLCNTLYNTTRLKDIGGFHSLHNLLEDNFALVKLLEKWTHGEIKDIKASYRYTYDQRTYQVPVVEWCQDFRELLSMIVLQFEPEQRSIMHKEGKRFFGQLCVRRANAIASAIKRTMARIDVARYFGLKTLRLSWRNPA